MGSQLKPNFVHHLADSEHMVADHHAQPRRHGLEDGELAVTEVGRQDGDIAAGIHLVQFAPRF